MFCCGLSEPKLLSVSSVSFFRETVLLSSYAKFLQNVTLDLIQISPYTYLFFLELEGQESSSLWHVGQSCASDGNSSLSTSSHH